MIVKGNQPSVLETGAAALAGPDSGFTGASWTEEGKGHGRREKRSIRTAPADGIAWPHAAQVRTGNQPNAYAAIRNPTIGAFRRTGFANIAHARRYYSRDDRRFLALYGYA